MKLLHKKFEYQVGDRKEGFTLENLLAEIHSNYGEQRIRIIQHDENEFIFKVPNHTRIGSTRVRLTVESKLLSLEIFEHYTAFLLFLYLMIMGAIGYYSGILSNRYGLLFIAVFMYFLWVLLDNHYTSRRRMRELLENHLSS